MTRAAPRASFRRSWPGLARRAAFGLTVPVAAVDVVLTLFILAFPAEPIDVLWLDGHLIVSFVCSFLVFGQPLCAMVALSLLVGLPRRVALIPRAKILVAEGLSGADYSVAARTMRAIQIVAHARPLERTPPGTKAVAPISGSARVTIDCSTGPLGSTVTLDTDSDTANEIARLYVGNVRAGAVAPPSTARAVLAAITGGALGLAAAFPLVTALISRGATLERATVRVAPVLSWCLAIVLSCLVLGWFAAFELLRPTQIALGNDGLRVGRDLVPWSDVRAVERRWWGLRVQTERRVYRLRGVVGARATLETFLADARQRLAMRRAAPELFLPPLESTVEDWVAAIEHRTRGVNYREPLPEAERLTAALRSTGVSPELRIASAIALRIADPENATDKLRRAARDLLDESTRATIEAIAEEDAANNVGSRPLRWQRDSRARPEVTAGRDTERGSDTPDDRARRTRRAPT
ncbi:MAG: hypothetical protein U0271_03890 [Polyangiaceae bacterium]